MKKHLLNVKTYEPGKPLEEVEREYGIQNAVKMASNENPLGASPKALAAIRTFLPKIHRYPEGGCFYLRRALAKKLKVDPKCLVFGNGSDELLVFAVRAAVGPQDEVIIANPTFLIYEIATQVENGRVVKVPMKHFQYDLEGMRAKINAKTRLIFIANPDNPVGTYVNESRLRKFLAAVPASVWVVVDEAYFEFARENQDYPDSLALQKKYPNLIVTRTFSKAYGLSGLRVGYAVASPEIARALNKVREPFNVNSVAQVAATAALEDAAHLKKTVRLTATGRNFLKKELTRLGFACVETSTNFVLADTRRDAKALYEALLRRGVIVRPMHAWGMGTFIRVTVGKPEENRRFLKELKEILQ